MRSQLLRLPLLLVLTALMAGILPVDAVFLYANTAESEGISPVAGSASHVLHMVKKRKKSRKSKKQKKSRSRRSSRRYTLRGNPEVTRTVASNLIAEKLPDLAQLVGLQAIAPAVPTQSDVQTEAVATADRRSGSEVPTAGGAREGSNSGAVIPTARTSMVAGSANGTIPSTGVAASAPSMPDYSDSELSEEEDPDKLSLEDEELLAEDEDLTIDEFYEEFTDYMAALNTETDMYVTDNGIDKIVAMETLMDWLGTRYLFGGTSRSGIDCSAFTRTVYGSLGCPLPRTAAMQWDVGDEIGYEELQFGDLVFFHTRSGVYVSHVGMYLGNDMFAHASSRNGVTVSSLGSNYYSTHFIGARRYDVAGAKAQAALENESMSEETSELEATLESEVVATRAQNAGATQVQ